MRTRDGGLVLALGVVAVRAHERDLGDHNNGGDEDGEGGKEHGGLDGFALRKGLVGEAVDEEDGGAGVEGAGDERGDEACVVGEGVGEGVGGDEEEVAAEAEEGVAEEVGVEEDGASGAREGEVEVGVAEVEGEGEGGAAEGEDECREEVAGAAAVVVEGVADEDRGDVEGDGGGDEEEV